MAYTVYKHTAPNGKVYIGITCKPVEIRWSNGKGYNHNAHFQKAIEKYGWENFAHEILFTGLSKEDACQKEIDLIAQYKSNNRNFGYNQSSGGENGHAGKSHSEEAKRRISEANKGNKSWSGKHHTEETKRKISESHKGIFPSEETRQKLSEAHKGKHPTEETRKKMSEVRSGENNHFYGKHLSENHRKKLSEAKKGEKHHNYGKHLSEKTKQKIGEAHKGTHHSDEAKQKMREAHSKKVICVENKIVYTSMLEAEQITGIGHYNISKACRGRVKTAGGYHWKYHED